MKARTLAISFILALLLVMPSVYAIKNPFRDVIINEIDPEEIDVLPGQVFCVERVIEGRWTSNGADFTAAAFFSDDLELVSVTLIDDLFSKNTPYYSEHPGLFLGHRKDEWKTFEEDLPKDLKKQAKQAVTKQFKLDTPKTIEFCFRTPTIEEVRENGKQNKGVIHYGAYGDDREDYEHSTYWDSGWKFKREFNISNIHANSLVNYTVQVILNTSNFQYANANETGKDIRFMNDNETIELGYWIEYWNNTGESLVWVKIPELDAISNTTFYAYYGNLEVESDSNKSAAMWYYNDFSSEPSPYYVNSPGSCPATPEDDPVNYWFNFEPVVDMDIMGFKANWDYVATTLNLHASFSSSVAPILFGDNDTSIYVGYQEDTRNARGVRPYSALIGSDGAYTNHPEVGSIYDMQLEFYDNSTINWTMTNKTTSTVFLTDSDTSITNRIINSFADKISGSRADATSCTGSGVQSVYGTGWGWNSTREVIVTSAKYSFASGNGLQYAEYDNLSIRNFVWPEPVVTVGEEITSIYLNLQYPNGTSFPNNWTTLNCSVLNDTGITLFVWHQGNGSIAFTDTQPGNMYEWNVTLLNDYYVWNCKAENYNVYAPSNATFRIDTLSPQCYCHNNTMWDKENANYTYTTICIDIDTMYINVTNRTTGAFISTYNLTAPNWTLLNFTDPVGYYNVTFWLNDTTGNYATKNCTLTLDAPNYYYAINSTNDNLNEFTINMTNGTTTASNYTSGYNLTFYNLLMPRGNVNHTVTRLGFLSYYENFTVDVDFIYQYTTFNLSKAGFDIDAVYDEKTGVGIMFNVSISNGYSVKTASNIWNYSLDWDDGLPLGEDVEVTVSSGGYETRRYYEDFTVTTRPNSTYYLLNSLEGILVRFHVRNNGGANLVGATVDVQKFINATWTTVSAGITDDSGIAAFFLDPTVEYKVIAAYSGVSTTVQIIPVTNDYTITIPIGEAVPIDYASAGQGVNYAWQPEVNNLEATNSTNSYINFSTYNFNNDFTEWGLNITYKGVLVFNSSSTSTGGGTIAAVFNLTNVTYDTSVYAVGWYNRSNFSQERLYKTYHIRAPTNASDYSLLKIFENFDGIGSGISNYARVVIAFVVAVVAAIAMFGMFGSGGGFAVIVILGLFILIGWFDPVEGFNTIYLFSCMAYVAYLAMRRLY